MAWNIKYHEELQIVETTFSGNILSDELGHAIMVSIKAVRDYKSIRLLADCSEFTGGHSLFDLYENANKIPSLGITKDFKEAILLPASDNAKEKVGFWETVTSNLGYKVRIFDDRDEAVEWLKI